MGVCVILPCYPLTSYPKSPVVVSMLHVTMLIGCMNRVTSFFFSENGAFLFVSSLHFSTNDSDLSVLCFK